MQYGSFSDSGKAFVINTPFTPTPWINRLFNDDIVLEISQRLQGGGTLTYADHSTEPFNNPENRFYLSVNGSCFELCKGQSDSYTCEHRLYQTEVTETFGNISVKIRVFLPEKGAKEFWTVELTNNGNETVDASSFCVFPFYRPDYMACETECDLENKVMYYYGFPYHITYAEKAEKEKDIRYRYVAFDVAPESWEGHPDRFFGCDDPSVMPAAVRNGRCSNGKGEFTPCIGALQHKHQLAPGESKRVNLMLGIEKTKDLMYTGAQNFPDIDVELEKIKQVWDKRCSMFSIKPPYEDLNALTNYWLKQQMVYFARQNRGGAYTCMRNQLQDYISYAMIDPEDAFARAIKVMARQHHNGFFKQHYNTDGTPERGLQRNTYSDPYIWLILCMVEIIENIGDKSLYQYPVGYLNSPLKEPVITHLKKAAYYMSTQLGEHGLCLLLDGDWNDPINGPGRKGKGESVWNSTALCFAIELLNKVEFDPHLDEVRTKLMNAVNEHCWDGNWYVAGLDDDGVPYGSCNDKAGQKFLNAQTWAIISGVATGERLEKVVETIESMAVPFGYLILDPLFEEYSPVWGKVSIKQSGTTENGSVYNHAVMFKALADCIRGDGDMARETILKILPTNPEHTPAESGQIPIYYSNYYYGRRNENFGRSSCAYSTGTVAWHIWVVLKYMFGFRSSSNGQVDVVPCLPAAWKNASMERVVGGIRYRLTYQEGNPNLEIIEG